MAEQPFFDNAERKLLRFAGRCALAAVGMLGLAALVVLAAVVIGAFS